MALDVVEKIKTAEERAEMIINTSKEESKKLLASVAEQSENRRKEFEKKIKEESVVILREAEKKAEDLIETAKTNTTVQCDKLKTALETKKSDAVKLVISEVLK